MLKVGLEPTTGPHDGGPSPSWVYSSILQDTFNLCKILDSNQWLLVSQTNARPTELISLLRFAVSVFIIGVACGRRFLGRLNEDTASNWYEI